MNKEQEILTITAEECGEVIQAISKIVRFGKDSYNPKDRKKVTNAAHLVSELGDLLACVRILHEIGLVGEDELMEAAEYKFEKLKKYSNLFNEERT
jgi:hypothetical protein